MLIAKQNPLQPKQGLSHNKYKPSDNALAAYSPLRNGPVSSSQTHETGIVSQQQLRGLRAII